jgi:hypothetical protein
MIIVVQQNRLQEPTFSSLKIGQIFQDEDGDFCMKVISTKEFNTVILSSVDTSVIGTLFTMTPNDLASPVRFNVTVTPE